MLIIDTSHIQDKIYYCCSMNLSRFIQDNGIFYVKTSLKWNEDRHKYMDCHEYIMSQQLSDLLKEWSARKLINNRYFDSGGENNG